MRGLRAALLAAGVIACATAQALPDDAAVRAILAQRIAQKQGVGFAVVLVDAAGTRVVTAGVVQRGGALVTADTEFEIGSITKTFTSLLLAQQVEAGTLTLDTPAARLLPEAAGGLAREGKFVTLGQLATHTSGLARLPPNMAPADRTNPYADYDRARLVAGLVATPLAGDPPAPYAYSNYGAGLLGYALTYRDGGYARVVRERILVPLGMADTAVDLTPAQRSRAAVGHDNELNPVRDWTFDALAGAGALRSTANDMAAYLRAAMDPGNGPLGPAFRLAETPRSDGPSPATRVGLAWHVTTRDGRTFTWHNGGTAGFASMLAFDAGRREGVVVLGNAQTSVDDLAFHLLDPAQPLAAPRVVRTAVTLAAPALDRVVGSYELGPGFVLKVWREGTRVLAQATGQGTAEVFPESENVFFYKVVDAQLAFTRDAAGNIDGVVLRQGGREVPGKRVAP